MTLLGIHFCPEITHRLIDNALENSAFLAAKVHPSSETKAEMAATGADEWLELMSAALQDTADRERRKSLRVPLHWTIYLVRRDSTHPQRTETMNLSRDGFYCLLEEPLTAGEHLDCDIIVPTHASDSGDTMSLRCHAQVLRVEKVHGGEFGLACRIQDYRVIHNPNVMPAPAGPGISPRLLNAPQA